MMFVSVLVLLLWSDVGGQTSDCDAKLNICHEDANCFQANGKLSCVCKDGFHGSGLYCEDIDECKFDNAGCVGATPRCVNTHGGYYCDCAKGFSGLYPLDGGAVTCTDINECEDARFNNCHKENADCENKPGSYKCKCKLGFTGDGKSCVDINECKVNNGDCPDVCENTLGSYVCVCRTGYIFLDGRCQDIDECNTTASTNNCHDNATCINRRGSYHCLCKTGFVGDGTNCTDIDECAEDNPCKNERKCTNTLGNYTCDCLPGEMGINCDLDCMISLRSWGKFDGRTNFKVEKEHGKRIKPTHYGELSWITIFFGSKVMTEIIVKDKGLNLWTFNVNICNISVLSNKTFNLGGKAEKFDDVYQSLKDYLDTLDFPTILVGLITDDAGYDLQKITNDDRARKSDNYLEKNKKREGKRNELANILKVPQLKDIKHGSKLAFVTQRDKSGQRGSAIAKDAKPKNKGATLRVRVKGAFNDEKVDIIEIPAFEKCDMCWRFDIDTEP